MSENKKRVLLVDDDPDFLFQQRIQLEASGYAVMDADGVEPALKILQTGSFDIAIIDLMMEETDAGFRLSREIKKINPSLPVIIISGVASETGIEFDTATKEERSWIKADAMLDKPVRFEQLEREINRLLKG